MRSSARVTVQPVPIVTSDFEDISVECRSVVHALGQLVELWNLTTMPTENVLFQGSRIVDDKIGPDGKTVVASDRRSPCR